MCKETNCWTPEPLKSHETSLSCRLLWAKFGLRFAYHPSARLDRDSRAGVGRKPGEQRFCFNATRANGTALSDRTGFLTLKVKKISLLSKLQLNTTGLI